MRQDETSHRRRNAHLPNCRTRDRSIAGNPPHDGVIVITALASLFDAGDAYMLGFVMPGIAKEFHAKPETLGLLAFASLIGMTWILHLGMDCRQVGPQNRLYHDSPDVLGFFRRLRFGAQRRLF